MAKEINEVSEELQILWEKRDKALKFEKNNGITPRSSKQYLKAQAEVDDYFFPKEEKANRKKPKKKEYDFDDDWMY